MAAERREPFRQALTELRRRLRDEVFAPGARIAARDLAEELHLSPTPVREALSRLAGEGLLEERRGDGYFAPLLSSADIAALYHLSEQLLLFAQCASPARYPMARGDTGGVGTDPVLATERLFWSWVAEAGSRIALETYRRVAARLAPIRRREGELIADLAQEAEALMSLADASDSTARPAAIRAFHARRLGLSEQLWRRLANNDLDARSPI